MISSPKYNLKENIAQYPVSYGKSLAFTNKRLKKGHDKRAYGNSFNATDETIDGLVSHITGGGAFTMGAFSTNRRIKGNFISSQIVALDLDDNVSVDYCRADDFILEHAFFIGATASSGKKISDSGLPIAKTRVLFLLDSPITESLQWERLQRAMLWRFADLNPDSGCKDCTRLFFGSDNPDYVYEPDNVLQVSVLEAIADDMDNELGKQVEARTAEMNTIIRDANRKHSADSRVQTNAQRYASVALDNMYSDLSSLSQGTGRYNGRNNTLFVFGARMGSMIASNIIDRSVVERDLLSAGLNCGMASHEARTTLARGINTGMQSPFDLSMFEKSTTSRQTSPNQIAGDSEDYTPLYAFKAPEKTIPDNEKWVNMIEDIPDSGVVIINSAMGTGKTEYAVEELAKVKRGRVVTPFISLTNTASNRFDIESYQNMETSYYASHDKLAITFKSLIFDGDSGDMDLVIFDEFCQLVEQLRSAIFSNVENIKTWYKLIEIIKTAKRVLILDATLKPWSYQWLKSLRDDVHFIHNSYTADTGTVTVMDDKTRLIDQMFLSLENPTRDKPVVFMSNARSKVLDIETMAIEQGYKTLSVHRENAQNIEQCELMKNPDSYIASHPEIDLYLLSPSVQSGVDIQSPMFAKFGLYIYSVNSTPASSGCAQSFMRARNADTSYIYVQDAKNSQLQENSETIYQAWVKQANITRATCIGNKFSDDYTDALMSSDDKAQSHLYADIEATDNAERNDLYKNTLNLLARNYARFEFDTEVGLKDTKEAVIETAKVRKEQAKQWTLTLDAMTDETYDKIQASGLGEPCHEYQNARYKIEAFYGRVIDEQLHTFDANGKGKARLRTYYNTFNMSKDDLEELDYQEWDKKVSLDRTKHHAVRASIMQKWIKAVWGDRAGVIANERLEMRYIAEQTALFMDSNSKMVKLYFEERYDYESDAWNLAKRMIKRLGLSFAPIRNRDETAPKEYEVHRGEYTYMRELIESYQDAKTDVNSPEKVLCEVLP